MSISGDVKAEGGQSRAILADTSSADIQGNISVSGDRSIGADVKDNSYVHIIGNVNTEGESSQGIRITDSSSADIQGNISVSGDKSVSAFDGAIGVDLKHNSYVNINGGINMEGEKATGIRTMYSSSADITGNMYVSGDNAIGVSSNGGGIVRISSGTVESHGIGSMALTVAESSDIYLDNTLVQADETLIFSSNLGSVTAANGSRLFGDIINLRPGAPIGELFVTLDGGSYLEGAVYDDAAAVANLTLRGSGDQWRVTDNSMINGRFTNNGTLDFSAAAMGTTVTVGDLNGNSNLIMKTDIAGQTGDRLVVTGATAGSHIISVANNGSANTTGTERIILVDTADQNGSFALTNDVALGAWIYSLRQVASGTGAYWELYGRGGGCTGPGPGPVAPSPGASGGVNTFFANYLMSYAETQTLTQRLGDLRAAQHLSGFWFRVHGGNFESNAKSFVKAFDMDYYGVQLGYDRKYDISWDGDLYAGIMFGYSKGDLDLGSGGSGDLDSKMLGLYGTFVAPSGFFADLIFKYQWMDNEFDVFNPGYERVTGDGVTTSGFGASLEFGQRIHLKEEQKDGWYMEPQVQLSYMRYDDDYFNASNGLHVGVEPFTSVLGRLGMQIGYENDKTNFYGKVSRVREFDGDVTIVANGVGIPESFSGSWWVYGIGYTSKINDRNSLYIDIERTSGGSFRQTWAAKAGWRIEF